jgi:guanyl-specific ribonuclease Sa
LGCSTISTRLPLNIGARFGADSVPSAKAMRAGPLSDLVAVSTAKPPSSPSISRTTRGDTARSNPLMIAAATLPVHAPKTAPVVSSSFI